MRSLIVALALTAAVLFSGEPALSETDAAGGKSEPAARMPAARSESSPVDQRSSLPFLLGAEGKNSPPPGVTPGFTPPYVPPDAEPPGQREPVVGFLAVLSIVIAAGAGLYVYRVIRKGL